MKKLLILLMLAFAGQEVNAQKSVDRVIDKLKKDDKAIAFTLPGWLLRSGINLADDENLRYENGFQDIVKGLKRLRIVHVSRNGHIPKDKLRGMINLVKEEDGFEDYATVRDQGTDVHVMVKEKGDRIRNLVLFANSNEGVTVLNLRTNIRMEDLRNANLSFNKND